MGQLDLFAWAAAEEVTQAKEVVVKAGVELALDELQEDPEEVKRRVLLPMSRWEKFYTEKWIDALVHALQAPIQTELQWMADVARKRTGDVVMERLLRLMTLSREHTEKFDVVGDADKQELYHTLAHEWKKTQKVLTNWEQCMGLAGCGHHTLLPDWAFEEFKRAFAHCFPFGVYLSVMYTEQNKSGYYQAGLLRLDKIKEFRYNCGWAKWPELDDREKLWIQAFNEKVTQLHEVSEYGNLFDKVSDTVGDHG